MGAGISGLKVSLCDPGTASAEWHFRSVTNDLLELIQIPTVLQCHQLGLVMRKTNAWMDMRNQVSLAASLWFGNDCVRSSPHTNRPILRTKLGRRPFLGCLSLVDGNYGVVIGVVKADSRRKPTRQLVKFSICHATLLAARERRASQVGSSRSARFPLGSGLNAGRVGKPHWPVSTPMKSQPPAEGVRQGSQDLPPRLPTPPFARAGSSPPRRGVAFKFSGRKSAEVRVDTALFPCLPVRKYYRCGFRSSPKFVGGPARNSSAYTANLAKGTAAGHCERSRSLPEDAIERGSFPVLELTGHRESGSQRASYAARRLG